MQFHMTWIFIQICKMSSSIQSKLINIKHVHFAQLKAVWSHVYLSEKNQNTFEY